MSDSSLVSSIPSSLTASDEAIPRRADNYTDDCPEDHIVYAPAGDDTLLSEDSIATEAPSGDAPPESAIPPAAEDNTLHGPPVTPARLLPWKTYLWFWVSLLGHALFAIFVTLIIYLFQFDYSDMIHVVMFSMVVAVFLVALFLNFGLTHAFHYLINKFPSEIASSIISLIVDAIYCAITILLSKLSKSGLVLYVHLISVTYSSTFMALLTYIFSEDVGNARAIFTAQALSYTLYYLPQQPVGFDVLLYAVNTVVGIATLIIRSDGPVESINVAFLGIMSFTPRVRVQSNNEGFPLRTIL